MNSPVSSFSKRRRASALVITLSFVVILTIFILAYFNVVTLDRLATRNYVQGLKAESVAQGAVDFVIGQLRDEMAQGGDPLSVGDYQVFPNVTSTNVMPERSGTDAAVPSLVKMPGSSRGVFSAATAVASEAASSEPSVNSRRISAGRWSRPSLGNLSSAPNWFLVGPSGITGTVSKPVEGRFAFTVYDIGSLLDINVAGFPGALTSAQKKELAGTPASLDLTALGLSQTEVNELITGFRNRASASDYASHVLTSSSANGFLQVSPGDDTFLSRQDFLAYLKWKGLSAATASNFTTFSRTLNAPAWGPFVSGTSFNIQTITRQDIVAWNPLSGASTVSVAADVNYQTDAVKETAANRLVLTQAVTGTFSRLDGSTAAVGEPLVIRRFPLDWLGWLSKDGPSQAARDRFGDNAKAAEKIKAAFGLVWDSVNRLWVYTSPVSTNGGGNYASGNSDGPATTGKAATTVKTLAVVASENREPDFFELLQAGILKGSLGQHSSIINPDSAPQPGEVTPQGHILQIGANIIDQYDADDYPTLIRAYMPVVMDASLHFWDAPTTVSFVIGSGTAALTPHDFAGVENLPCLMSLRSRAFRPQENNSSDGTRRFMQAVLMPQFWNPHRNAGNPSADRPAKLRVIQTFGVIRLTMMGNKRGSTTPTISQVNGVTWGYAGYDTSPPSEWPSDIPGVSQPMLEFTGAATFAQPGFLKPSMITATSRPENIQKAIIADDHTVADVDPDGFVGFSLGRAPAVGTEPFVATDPKDEQDDNTPIDSAVWSKFTGLPAEQCPVQQYLNNTCWPVKRNFTSLPSSDRFWKGDTTLAASGQRFPVFELQYLDGTVWKTYQRFDGVMRAGGADWKWDTTSRPSNYAGCFTSEIISAMYGRVDPRGSRFGLMHLGDSNGTGAPSYCHDTPFSGVFASVGRPNGEASINFNGTLISGNQGGAEYTDTFDPANEVTRWTNYSVPEWQNNLSTGQRYTDNDRILRRGDGDTAHGVDLLSSGTAARPVVLNRPFATVGDLGYVYRDLPFKTLDFFSANSADGALLDLFTVHESPSLVAGKVNLNGRNPAVMKLILSSAVIDEASQSTLTATQSETLANLLASGTAAAPFAGLWSLPSFLETDAYRNAVPNDLARMKTQAEAVSRRLSAMTDTRCWNLLVDIVAQTGRYAPGATDPSRFNVEGERRYWLQIAIDRFTGEVVSRQLEPVNE